MTGLIEKNTLNENLFCISTIYFQHLPQWNRKLPVGFQSFSNNNFKQSMIAGNGKQFYRVYVKFGLPSWGIEYVEDESYRSSVQTYARYHLQPGLIANRDLCVVMFLTNLESPDWIAYNCFVKYLSQILCRIDNQKKNNASMFLKTDKKEICLAGQIIKNATCLLFVWKHKILHMHKTCERQGMKNMRIKEISSLFFILLATNIAISPVLSFKAGDKKTIHRFQFDEMSLKYKLSIKSSTMDHFEGYYICESKSHITHIGISIFRCKSGVLILSLYLCNGIFDCPYNDTSDEELCKCSYSEENTYPRSCKEST